MTGSGRLLEFPHLRCVRMAFHQGIFFFYVTWESLNFLTVGVGLVFSFRLALEAFENSCFELSTWMKLVSRNIERQWTINVDALRILELTQDVIDWEPLGWFRRKNETCVARGVNKTCHVPHFFFVNRVCSLFNIFPKKSKKFIIWYKGGRPNLLWIFSSGTSPCIIFLMQFSNILPYSLFSSTLWLLSY